jgi:hypothetical protein
MRRRLWTWERAEAAGKTSRLVGLNLGGLLGGVPGLCIGIGLGNFSLVSEPSAAEILQCAFLGTVLGPVAGALSTGVLF